MTPVYIYIYIYLEIYILEMKNTISKIKNSLDGFKRRSDIPEDRNNTGENRSINISKLKCREKKK